MHFCSYLKKYITMMWYLREKSKLYHKRAVKSLVGLGVWTTHIVARSRPGHRIPEASGDGRRAVLALLQGA
jgi:hypothetical protein